VTSPVSRPNAPLVSLPNTPTPFTTVGVIGGGQLAWMLAAAAQDLGLPLIVQTPHAQDPAVSLAQSAILAPLDDLSATAALAQQCQVITFENEFVDLAGLAKLQAQGVCFRPSLSSLEPLLDKYEQRSYLQRLGLPVPQFAPLTPEALAEFNWPVVVKARRHGYDGQGTFILKNPTDLKPFWARGTPAQVAAQFMVEAFVPFERELAIVAARAANGEVVAHPLVETQQEQQVCRRVWVAQDLGSETQHQALAIVKQLLTDLDVVGLWGVELFLTPEGHLLVNEIAPRTHNSGHFSLDACLTSQFEQHLRAICGLPLCSTALKSPGVAMVNLLGFETATSDYLPQRQRLAALPNAHVYWYGKNQARPGRKLGHVTVLLGSPERSAAMAVAEQIENIWYG
jgi:5-(carboxyamino)imidazole ribonucleotide synthase